MAMIVARDQGRCWICGHWNAFSADHIIPVTERPDLEWSADNCKAAHAWPKGCPDCSIGAGKPVYCNAIKGMGSVERARRLITERTGLVLPVSDTRVIREGREW